MRRIILVVTVAAMMAALLMAVAGAALADDVCVSHEGETIYDSGPSFCHSDPTSGAVAVNNSDAFGDFDGEAVAVNGSEALAGWHSGAFAFDSCSATALNGEVESCR